MPKTHTDITLIGVRGEGRTRLLRGIMKSFACGEVVPNCEASWVCSTEDEILARVAEHATEVHGLETVSPDLVAAVRAHIRTA